MRELGERLREYSDAETGVGDEEIALCVVDTTERHGDVIESGDGGRGADVAPSDRVRNELARNTGGGVAFGDGDHGAAVGREDDFAGSGRRSLFGCALSEVGEDAKTDAIWRDT